MEKPAAAAGASAPSTTYVHADAGSFRDVVQRLTGPVDAAASVRSPSPPPARAAASRGALRSPSPTSRVAGVKRPPMVGLQDRRQCPPRPALVIPKPAGFTAFSEGGGSSRGSAATSPGVPSPSPPPRSPLMSPSTNMANLSLGEKAEPGDGDSGIVEAELNEEEEEKAIKAKRFYLHPSPRSGQKKAAEPELLQLFPVTTTPAEA